MTYGKRLDQALTNAGKSRKDLATHLDCAPQTIGIVITGAGKIGRKLSTDNHARAVEFLKINGEWLLTGEGDMLPATATASITAPSPTISSSNHAPAHIQKAQPAINNAVSLTTALATLQNAIRSADPLDRASCKPYIAAMFDDPDRVDLVHRIITALDPPSHKAEPETGALRRTA